MATKLELKKLLFDAYGGFADKRLKNLERDAPFIVDDRSDRDLDAQNQLYLWHCQIFATVDDADRVEVELRGGVPYSAAVSEWYAVQKGEERPGDYNGYARFVVTPENIGDLPDLAQRFAAITKRRYPVKAWTYVVPRTADSLLKLHGVLSNDWR
ncbi:MAG: hypothetical protein AAFO63_01670 [Pseudomonadota bacterium]